MSTFSFQNPTLSMNMPSLPRTILIVLALCSAGCASTYSMPGLPTGGPSSIAVLEHQDKSKTAKFFITRIDSQPRGFGWIDRFELTPGRRAVTASINGGGGFAGANITRYFTAEAGMNYTFIVHDDPVAKRWSFSIVQTLSGLRVDSAAP
jgi:hypothetical protein